MFINSAGAGKTNAGTLTVSHSGGGNVFSVIAAGDGQTRITAYTVPRNHTGFLVRYQSSVFDNTSNRATLAIRLYNPDTNVQRDIRPFVTTTSAFYAERIYGALRIEEKTDIVFRALAVQNANARITVDYELAVLEKSINLP